MGIQMSTTQLKIKIPQRSEKLVGIYTVHWQCYLLIVFLVQTSDSGFVMVHAYSAVV